MAGVRGRITRCEGRAAQAGSALEVGCRAHRPWFGAPDCPGPIGSLGQFVSSQMSRGASAARLPAAGGRLRELVQHGRGIAQYRHDQSLPA
jgi:hypothetical protein